MFFRYIWLEVSTWARLCKMLHIVCKRRNLKKKTKVDKISKQNFFFRQVFFFKEASQRVNNPFFSNTKEAVLTEKSFEIEY